ncbi:MAG: N-acetylmuramoyl-L-alanine amidase [Candidatus Promineifilaceae bacterium]
MLHNSPRPQSPLVRILRQNLAIIGFLILSIGGMTAVYWYFNPDPGAVEAAAIASIGVEPNENVIAPDALTAPIFKTQQKIPVSQRLAQSAGPLRIGIIAGHSGNDSGAVCEDGLEEVQVTTSLAQRLAARLQSYGITTDLLEEFDPQLDGYTATALVSIHVDSCDYINDLATGFKISGSPYTDSSQLSICVEQAYQEATGLSYHPNSITPHMTNYHAFRQIATGTPAIIIEVGFLYLDRDILTAPDDHVVEGLTNGIFCYLDKTP